MNIPLPQTDLLPAAGSRPDRKTSGRFFSGEQIDLQAMIRAKHDKYDRAVFDADLYRYLMEKFAPL